MKTTLLLTLTTLSLLSSAHAKSLFSNRETYVEVSTKRVVEIATNETQNLDMSLYSPKTSQEIAGVRAGERILVTTGSESRYCDVFYVFENKMARVGCIGLASDQKPNKDAPKRIELMVNNVETVTPEVSELDGFKTKEVAELRINTKIAKAGRNVRIIAIFANGEALVEKTGYSFFSGSNVVDRGVDVERLSLTDLNKKN